MYIHTHIIYYIYIYIYIYIIGDSSRYQGAADVEVLDDARVLEQQDGHVILSLGVLRHELDAPVLRHRHGHPLEGRLHQHLIPRGGRVDSSGFNPFLVKGCLHALYIYICMYVYIYIYICISSIDMYNNDVGKESALNS
jgi:hypothetical protein